MLADSGGVTGTNPGCEPSPAPSSLTLDGGAAVSVDGNATVTDEDGSACGVVAGSCRGRGSD